MRYKTEVLNKKITVYFKRKKITPIKLSLVLFNEFQLDRGLCRSQFNKMFALSHISNIIKHN